MNIICPISGETLIRSDLFLGEDYIDLHPIFRVPRSKFIKDELVHRFNKSTNVREKKLYFLAVLNCTDLVAFNVVAKPSLQIVEDNFLSLIEFVGWMDFAYYSIAKEVSWPHYVVSSETETLHNVHVFIDACLQVRAEFLKKDSDQARRRALTLAQQKLEKEFHDAHLKDRVFTPFAARWAIEYAGLKEHPRADSYYNMLTTKESEAWGLDKYALAELKELMVDNLNMSHPLCSIIVGQINQLERIRSKGVQNFETIYMPQTVEIEGITTTTQVPTQDYFKSILLKLTGKLEQPFAKDFGNRLDFFRANAAWIEMNKKRVDPPPQTIIKAPQEEKTDDDEDDSDDAESEEV